MPIARQQIHNKQQWSKWESVFSMQSVLWLCDATTEELLGTPTTKKAQPLPFIKGGTMKKEKNKSLDTEQIYGHGSQRGSMPRVTVLAGCQQ
jgi:hypothetical protein